MCYGKVWGGQVLAMFSLSLQAQHILPFLDPWKSTWNLRAEMGPCKQALQPNVDLPKTLGDGSLRLGSMSMRVGKRKKRMLLLKRWRDNVCSFPPFFLSWFTLYPSKSRFIIFNTEHSAFWARATALLCMGCKTYRTRTVGRETIWQPWERIISVVPWSREDQHFFSKRSPYKIPRLFYPHLLQAIGRLSPSTGGFPHGVVHIPSWCG